MHVRAALLLSLAVALGSGCARRQKKTPPETGPELGDVGVVANSDQPVPGIDRPIARGDLRRVTEVGRWLHAGEHAIDVALAHAVTPRGTFPDDLVLPVVDVDPGNGSAQVMFVRWPGAARTSEPPEVRRGERWMLVSLLMDAEDKVLDTQVLHGTIEPDSPEGERVAALLAATMELRRVAPGHTFFALDRLRDAYGDVELAPRPGKKPKPRARKIVTHVWALAREPGGPDLEIVIDTPPKKGLPPVLRHDVVHPSGAFDRSPLTLTRPEPSPLTVARALRRPQDTLLVHAQDGRYAVSGTTGAVQREPTAAP